jgi:hypothetical protein
MKKTLKLKIIGTVVILVLCTLVTLAFEHKKQGLPKIRPSIPAMRKTPAFDPILLRKYEALSLLYDTVRASYTMAGVINLHDPADSAANMKDVAFFFSRSGDNFYYKLGTTMTINMEGLYVYVDEKGRSIVIGEQKNVISDQASGAFISLSKNLMGEGYALTGQLNGSQQTLTITNEHHLSCKQMSVTYDTLNMHIGHLRARLTNLVGVKKDKTLDIAITEWATEAKPEKYINLDDVIKKEDGKWIAVKQYKGFSIITI